MHSWRHLRIGAVSQSADKRSHPAGRNISPVDVHTLVYEVADDGYSIVEGCPLQGVVAHFVWLVEEAGIGLCCFPEVLIVAVYIA